MKMLFSLAMVFMVFFSGCYTKRDTKSTYIDEKVYAFMINQENKSFVIVGEKYHYIFEANRKFEYLLQNLNEAYTFEIEDGGYYINHDNTVFAMFSIDIDEKKVSKKFLDWAKKNGAFTTFKKGTSFKEHTLVLRISMQGKLYLPNKEFNKSVPKLNKEYKIKVSVEEVINKELVMLSPLQIALIPSAIFITSIMVGTSIRDGHYGKEE